METKGSNDMELMEWLNDNGLDNDALKILHGIGIQSLNDFEKFQSKEEIDIKLEISIRKKLGKCIFESLKSLKSLNNDREESSSNASNDETQTNTELSMTTSNENIEDTNSNDNNNNNNYNNNSDNNSSNNMILQSSTVLTPNNNNNNFKYASIEDTFEYLKTRSII